MWINEAGMDAYVSKPINETDLRDKILRLATKKPLKDSDQKPKITEICNLDTLKISLQNKPKLVAEMLQLILKETPVIIEQMKDHLNTKDWDDFYRKIHSIQPTLQLMGLPEALLIDAKEENQLELIPVQFINFERALKQAFKELEEVLKTIKIS